MESLVMEGFEPHTVATEILENHLTGIFDVIEQPNYDQEKFSSLIVNRFMKMLQELLSEISEGFYDGIEGLEKVYKASFRQHVIQSFGPEMGAILNEMAPQMTWDLLIKAYKSQLQAQAQLQLPQTQPQVQPNNVLFINCLVLKITLEFNCIRRGSKS